MAEIAQLPREKAKFYPGDIFASPDEIVQEILMTRGEKIATLKRWREDVVSQLRAADDGMQTRQTSARHAELLRKIETSLSDLQGTEQI